jgi:hypothetical protein
LPYKYTRLDSLHPKSSQDQAVTTHQATLAHALPTSHVEDPDLTMIVGMWDRIADECKRRLIDIVRANLTTHGDVDELDETDERGGRVAP